MWPFASITVLYLSFIGLALGSTLVLHEKRDDPLPEQLQRQRIESHALLPMRIGLMQNEHAQLNAERWLMDVSHPDSPSYGRYWTSEQVVDIFKPSDATIRNVTSWLSDHNILDFTYSDNKMWFVFDIPASKAEAMLQTEYYEHTTANGESQASCDSYHLPHHLTPHIHYITPGIMPSSITGRTKRSRQLNGHTKRQRLVESSPLPRRSAQATNSTPPPDFSDTSLENCYKYVTPKCMQVMYNYSAPDPSLPVSPNNIMGIFEADGDTYTQDYSNLFFKYMAPNIPQGTSPYFDPIDGTLYPPTPQNDTGTQVYPGPESNLDLQVALPIIYPQNVTIFEVEKPGHNPWGFNFWNRFADAIDGSYCTQEQRANGSSGRPQCGILKPTNVISSSYYTGEIELTKFWQDRQCNEYLKLGLQGVSMFHCSGDQGVNGIYGLHKNNTLGVCDDKSGPRVFLPSWPAGCPWITSVGGTQIKPNHTVYDREMAWNAEGESGGGFSLNFEAPDYQKDALSYYFENHDPKWPYFYNGDWRNGTGRYNRNGRGIPDLSAVAQNISVWYAEFGYGGGTSSATPLVAALFNRIIEERIRVGKGRLGFINPVIYKHPEAFNDIAKGGNGECEHSGGFQAVPGWDPVTGLGTPNYSKLLKVFLNLP